MSIIRKIENELCVTTGAMRFSSVHATVCLENMCVVDCICMSVKHVRLPYVFDL